MDKELLKVLKENLKIRAKTSSVPYSDSIEMTISLIFKEDLIDVTTVYL